MKSDFSFKGMLVPVFTPFLDDQKRTINFEVIDRYVQYLKNAGMNGIMINGMFGEGMVLSLEERMRVTEVWLEAARKHGLVLVVNIGGIDLPSMYKLAEHAEKLQVDAVLLMPDLFYKPIVEEDLVLYFKDIIARMPTRPVLYYHLPSMITLRLDILRLLGILDKEVPMFSGIYWAHDQIDRLILIKEKFPRYNYIVGSMVSMVGYMSEGIEAISLPLMNILPELIRELHDLMMNRNLNEAIVVHKKLLKHTWELLRIDSDLRVDLDIMFILRREIEKIVPAIKLGPMRRPHLSMNRWIL